MDASRIIAERIGSLIDGKGKPQREQAAEIGISPQALSDYRNGNREPGLYAATRLADYFGVSLDYLVGKHECKTPDNEQIHKVLGLSDEAIKALKELNSTEHWGRLTPIQKGAIRALNALLVSKEGRAMFGLVGTYLYANFERPYVIEANYDNDDDDDGFELIKHYSNRIYVDLDNERESIMPEVLSEGVLLRIIAFLRNLKEGKKHVDPEDSE